MQTGAKAPTRCKDSWTPGGGDAPGHPGQREAGGDSHPSKWESKTRKQQWGGDNREGGQLSPLALQQLVGDTDETAPDTAVAATPGREGSVRGGSRPGPTQGTKRPAHRRRRWAVRREHGGRGEDFSLCTRQEPPGWV